MTHVATSSATLDLDGAARRRWDVVVVGAGPAGSMAARELARSGAAVLLVDKAKFPRGKVCGCCLNGMALAELGAVGLAHLPDRLGAVGLSEFQIASCGRSVSVPLPAGASISREALDAALIAEATIAGAAFLPGTSAQLGRLTPQGRTIRLHAGGAQATVEARVALAADGLSGRFLAGDCVFRLRRARGARVGGATIIECAAREYADHTIYMACGRSGYVGLVRLERGLLNVAAAVDPSAVRSQSGIGPLVAGIITDSGFSRIDDLAEARWRGVPRLTQSRSPLADGRIFVIGDAAGYVEPFTGEGMAMALAGGRAVVPLVLEAVVNWQPDLAQRWRRRYRALFGRRRLACGVVTRGLRHPWLTRAVVAGLALAPHFASLYVRRLNRAAVRLDHSSP